MSIDVQAPVAVDGQAPVADSVERALPRLVCARTGGLAVAAALFAAGAFFMWQSVGIPFGSVGLPGPGFFPFALGIGLSLFSLGIAADVRRDRSQSDPVEIGHRDVIVVFVSLLAVCLAFESLGALVSLGLFTMALLVFLARVSVVVAAASAAVGMAAVWGFFKMLLGLQLPPGLL